MRSTWKTIHSQKIIMNKYNNDALSELCSKFNLFEYVEQNYEVKKMAGRYYINCPLHSDKTPSLCFDTENNKFHCFSCGVHGSPIDWFRKVEQKSFNESINIIQKYIGEDVSNLKICETLALYKSIKHIKSKKEVQPIEHEIIPYSAYDKFSKEPPAEWVEENMSPEVLREYDVRIDNSYNRIVYPIYDNQDHLIGYKGRTRFKDYKALGITKYMNYKKVGKWDFFVGMNTNRLYILEANSVVIFEGIKSGMKYTTYTGKRNWLSAETSVLNEDQVNILIQLRIKTIIIAFDSDVDIEKIKKCTSKLKRFANVFVMKNYHNLLGEKESPIDRGIEVYNTLLKQVERI